MTAGQLELDFGGEFPDHWLPRWPLAGPKKGAKHRMPRPAALEQPYIQANVSGVLQSLIITDHDGHDAIGASERLGLPPSYVSVNPYTENGHIVYALSKPVCLTDAARRPPVLLLATVEHGMMKLFQGDGAFAGTFTKSPYSDEHTTVWGPSDAAYGLSELVQALRAAGALPRRGSAEERLLTESGVGRNVALFDIVREWAYAARGAYKNPREWDEVVFAYAMDRNQVVCQQFSRGPMGDSEVKGIAQSVSRWTWRNIRHSREEWGERNRRRAARVRRARAEAEWWDALRTAKGDD